MLNGQMIALRYIPTIEHYVNSHDIVPRWGVLYHARRKSEDAYSGTVLVHENATGHLFDQHYLEVMFPKHFAEDDRTAFLNHVVINDDEQGIGKAMTWIGPRKIVGESNVPAEPAAIGLVDVHDEQILASPKAACSIGNMQQERKVRDLSRLSKYFNGRSPSSD